MVVEEREVMTDYYSSTLSWLDSPIPKVVTRRAPPLPLPSSHSFDIPSTSQQKNEYVTVEAFKKFEDKVEADLAEIKAWLESIDSRVRKLEEGNVNPQKLELSIVRRLKNAADFHFQLSVHRLSKELRTELNLPPKDDEGPKIIDMDADDEEKSESGGMAEYKAPVFDMGDYAPVFETEQTQGTQDADMVLSVMPEAFAMKVEKSVVTETEDVCEESVKVEKSDVEENVRVEKGDVEETVKDETSGIDEAIMTVVASVEDEAAVGGDDAVEDDAPLAVLVGQQRARSKRTRKLAPVSRSPFIDPSKKRKVEGGVVEELVIPHPKPTDDHDYSQHKDKVLFQWLKKNGDSKTVGVPLVVTQFDSISCEIMGNLYRNGKWLSNDNLDACMQLLILQQRKYPEHFPASNWTCMNSLYNQRLPSNLEKFDAVRAALKKSGIVRKDVDWASVDQDVYLYALGFNEVWCNQSFGLCDYILGIDNINMQHWFAYRYNFPKQTVEVYDSMKNAFQKGRQEVVERHAKIAASLYNINQENYIYMLDPDVPFKIEYIADVPQQHNGYDCGVYAIKIVQCLVMQDDYRTLQSGLFKDFRKKMAIDLVKWQKLPNGKFTFEEQHT